MKEMGGGYSFPNVKQSKDKVIYAGFLYDLWGHVLTDDLKKFWFLLSDEGKEKLASGYRVIYITMNNRPLSAYCKEFFSLASMDLDSWERVSEPTQYAEVIVPDNSLVAGKHGRQFFSQYKDIINSITRNVDLHSKGLKHFDKIYLTRSYLKSNKDFGEKSLESVYKKCGYEIIAPEQYSIPQQIYYMMTCSDVVATEGSVAHNAVFCKPKTNLTIIRKANYINGYQIAINEVANLNVTYIDSNRSHPVDKEAIWAGPFYLYDSPKIYEQLGLKKHGLPVFLRINYWCYMVFVLLKKLKGMLNHG